MKQFYRYCLYYPVVFLKTESFFKKRSELEKSQYDSEELIQKSSLEKLNRIVNYSRKNVPEYERLYDGLNVDEFQTIDDFKKLPFVSKEMLKNPQTSFVSREKHKFCTVKTTGGSTGQPVTLLKSRYAMGCELAATWRGYSWANIEIGDRQARFWGVPFSSKDRMVAKTIDFICNRHRLSAFSFDSSSLEQYFQSVVKAAPDYFYGYVSMLNEFADYLLENKISYPLPLKAIVTTSEVLTQEIRTKLESVFSTRVYNEYGCGELGSVAHECSEGNFHTSVENMFVEIIDENGNPCESGQVGEIVVSELNNTAMPLIRYRLGDLGAMVESGCKCGRKLPILKEVKGRAYDTVTLENGVKYHGEFFMYIMEGVKRLGYGLTQFQVEQVERNQFLVRLVVSRKEDGPQIEKYIRENVLDGMGDDVGVSFTYVDGIPRSNSGKMQLIKALQN